MPSKYNGRILRKAISSELKIDNCDLDKFIISLYDEGLSGVEISEFFERETGVKISPRSVQRRVKKFGNPRSLKDSFNNAVKRGRVVWQLEEDKKRRECARHQINRGLRLKVLERDEFKCTLCGSKEFLQVDHIIARMNGGEETFENLRTLCLDCNIGKQINEKENLTIGGWKSGIKK